VLAHGNDQVQITFKWYKGWQDCTPDNEFTGDIGPFLSADKLSLDKQPITLGKDLDGAVSDEIRSMIKNFSCQYNDTLKVTYKDLTTGDGNYDQKIDAYEFLDERYGIVIKAMYGKSLKELREALNLEPGNTVTVGDIQVPVDEILKGFPRWAKLTWTGACRKPMDPVSKDELNGQEIYVSVLKVYKDGTCNEEVQPEKVQKKFTLGQEVDKNNSQKFTYKDDGETLQYQGKDVENGTCVKDGSGGSVKFEWTGACTKFPVWAIVLIVIGGLLFVGLVGFLIYWYGCRKAN
jgi:hypothetical protein